MRHTYIALCCLLICSFMSCETKEPPPPPAPSFSELILGTWETIEVEAKAPTYQGLDTTVHHLIREADWGRLYGVRPSRTVYTDDGKLKRTYYSSAGAVTDVTNGLWREQGQDSLLVIEPNTTLNYRYQLEGGRLTLSGIIDWDYDGEKDDEYRAVLRLVSKTE
ncbi:MAG: hypothetical protein AAF840_09870 [Bacteroidota bacterium]